MNISDQIFCAEERQKIGFKTNESEFKENLEELGRDIFEVANRCGVKIGWLSLIFNSVYFGKFFIVPESKIIGIDDNQLIKKYLLIRRWLGQYDSLSLSDYLLHSKRIEYMSFGLYCDDGVREHGGNFEGSHFYFVLNKLSGLIRSENNEKYGNGKNNIDCLKKIDDLIDCLKNGHQEAIREEYIQFRNWLRLALPDHDRRYDIYISDKLFSDDRWLQRGFGLVIAFILMELLGIPTKYIYFVPISSTSFPNGGINFSCSQRLGKDELDTMRLIVDEFLMEFVFEDFMSFSRRHGLSAAVAAIMARNMSHIHGSHIEPGLQNSMETFEKIISQRLGFENDL